MAIPEGIFRGKSKQVWDYLWSISRGAVVPVRTVRKSRGEIKAGAGLGSMVTVDASIIHLKSVGLISVKASVGSLMGNEYEVFTPEEVAQGYTSTTSTSSTTSLTQKVVVLDVLDSSISSTTQPALESITSDPSKTFFKTNTDDDETHTLAELTKTLVEAARSIVGGELINSEQERERWKELGQLLAEELKEAAKRTRTISSVPAFLTAHLRRRLAPKPAPLAENKKSVETNPRNYQTFASEVNSSGKKDTNKSSDLGMPATGKSKFSLEECRLYADHLHTTGQGITNPGGFAMTIYRSGISDALIEKFLHPAEGEAPLDASACPDCKGTGFHYPRGVEQGVVKCKHEKLKNPEARRKLTPEEIVEQTGIISELLESGYTMEQAETQFAASLESDDWAAIRARLIERNV
ncbi:MAG TPA: hypothetical protein VF658_22100 [Pyrinomonadaceae bacterium]|jgi:hypothetical protein